MPPIVLYPCETIQEINSVTDLHKHKVQIKMILQDRALNLMLMTITHSKTKITTM